MMHFYQMKQNGMSLRIIALKEVLSNPRKYGFKFEEKDLYTMAENKNGEGRFYNYKYCIVCQNNLALNYKELKLHNAWLRENKLNNKSHKSV